MRRVLFVSLLFMGACASKADPVAGPPFWFDFIFFHTAFDSEPASAMAVTVVVTKDDPEAGLVSWRGICVEGDRIGWGVEDGVRTSTHRVRSPRLGGYCDVDFDSGTQIRWIRGDVEMTYVYPVCQIDPKASACTGIRYMSDKGRADEVTYVDRSGMAKVVRIPRGRSPWPGQRCPLHEGPQPGPDRRSPSDRLASELFFQAGNDWVSHDPVRLKRAKLAYGALLRDHPFAPVVEKYRGMILNRAQIDLRDR
jgi:hypothetical protein